MKKQIFIAAAVLFSAGILFFTGCKKDDSTPPVVSLTGDAAESSILNAAWTDKGATATDDKDGEVTVSVAGTVDKDKAGDYKITYTATDAAGNEGTAVRTVTVYNEAKTLAGDYDVSEDCGTGTIDTYTQTVTFSTTVNKEIHFNKFGNYKDNVNIYANLKTSTTLDLPAQTATAIGLSSQTHTFTGMTGSVTTATGFTLKFTDLNVTAGGAAATCTDTYTKK